LENEIDLPKRQNRGLAETYAKNRLCEKITLPEKMYLAKKTEQNLPKLLLKNIADFESLTWLKRTQAS
jgi:hypothetical protein